MKASGSHGRKGKWRFAFALLGAIVLLSARQAYTASNYPDPAYPSYSGTFAVASPESTGTLTVVSYNIWFGQDIEQAVSELKHIQSNKGLDILLFQEMDEAGTEQIARALELNYVYFPAAVEPTYGKNFGNAILTHWTFVDAEKLILPHKSLSNRMNRTATQATINVNGTEILVYSLHTESIFTLPRFREDQYRAVLDDVHPEADLVIVGGDFNSFRERDVEVIENIFRQAGFVRVSAGSGPSMAKYGMNVSSDHIFAKGFLVQESGKLTEATASDHLPIWVVLMPE